jgi:ribosomal RNA-processing protein 12
MAELEQALAKIRPHTSSNLPHQKTPATLLLALESTFQEQSTQKSSTAYFAALLTTLDGTLQKNDVRLGDGDVLPAELYLLALVAPFVSPSIVRANLNTILSLTAPLFPALLNHAPPLRSQLALYHAILRSLDKSQLDAQGIRQAFASILRLCVDARPKVRKAAADLVKDVLSEPPSPMARHPYADTTAQWLKSSLGEVNALPRANSNPKLPETPTTESAIHILALLRPIALYLPPAVSPPSVFYPNI